ncbi:RasGEF domain [Phytophthora infestans]|uniref:RasGEF domain n=1 Tax=Phytophthora infestans TaxID=4787 RepID=A0A8S9U8L8_PHYIN|nr:RasGEF domain [Phytophthora infestans]
MDSTTSSSKMDEIEIIKEGSVAVRGHFMWRDRYVLVKPGEIVIRRRREGSIKAKIDLLDANIKLTFLGGQSLLTISMHGRDTVFDFRSTVTRDEWISAIVSAQERPESDEECDENGTELLSGDELDDHKRSSMSSMGTEKSDLLEEDGEGYSDALLALQSVRDSVMQCHLSMGAAEVDTFLTPRDNPATPAFTKIAPSLRRVQSAKRSEEELRQKRLRSLLTMIESTRHGGRVVLLHLGVVASAGITVGDMLLALGEKQRDNPRLGSFTPRTLSTQKHNVASFVRDILFHPIYSKREEVNTEVVQGLIDLFFPHCRLRRFSDDTEWQQANNVSRVPTKSENDADIASAIPVNTPTTPNPTSRAPQRKKRRNHSFPNLTGISQLAKNKGLLLASTDDNDRSISSRKCEEGGAQRLRDNLSVLFAPLHPSPGPGGGREPPIPLLSSSTLFDSTHEELDLICEDVPLPAPLRSLLWEMSCSEMAEQLTVFHHSQLTNVYPWEFLHHPRQAAKELTDHFNRLVAYFVWSVLVEDSPKERAEVIEDIISIAMAASAPPLNNFHLVMACVGCLGDTPLMSSRMPTTWKKVRAKYKTRLGELRRLCDHTGGFENLRRKQSTESARPVLSSDVSTASIIPFVGVIGVMLERLRSTSYFIAKKMLDLDKLERQYMVLNVLENALLKPAPRPSRAPQRGKTAPTETADQMTTRMQHFFATLKMDFATSRLHQLRSQQILANETSATSSASTSFVLTATVNGSNRGGAPLTASLATNSSHGSIGLSEDSGLPFVSFRDICVLLVSVLDTRERIQMALEALFVDGRQSATQFLRKFWLDFKLNVWISGVGPTLHSVRLCVSALYQEVMTHKITELMQISGLDENSSDLHDMVYVKIVVITVQPIYLKIVSKVKRNFVKEDAHASARLLKSTPQVVVDTSKPTMPWSSCSSSSPVELLDLVCQLVALPRASTTTATVAATDHQLAAVELLGALQHQGRHTFLATNPVSSLYLMKQILEPKYLPLARRQALDVFVAAVTWLRKEQSASSDAPQVALV